MKKGIDYSGGLSNVDHETGIHYGVISVNEVCQVWCEESEPFYVFSCPVCGEELNNEATEMCPSCGEIFQDGEFDEHEPEFFYLSDGEYIAEQDSDDVDIFITKSPYYTTCQFCSPCAPGAGYIMNTVENGVKTYCFGHDFFENGKAPYPVYSVETGDLI